MTTHHHLGRSAVWAATAAALLPIGALAQDAAKPGQGQQAQPAGAAGDSIEKIAEDYHRQLLELDRQRLDRLTRLAAGQDAGGAAYTYEQLFQLAIAGNLFREAEPAALAVIAKGSPSPTAVALAHLVKIIAECDRGAYEQSLESLRTVVVDKDLDPQLQATRGHLLVPEKIELCDAYYQRLIHADQFDVARKALTLLKERAKDPDFVSFLDARLARLAMIGKPAPGLQGTDLDGKKLSLADYKGSVVLVVFWASWNLPSTAEVAALHEVDEAYRSKGFRVIGINVDPLQEGAPKPEAAAPLVRRFLLDRNVTWPNLLSGTGEQDYTRLFGVTEIPANVLIARDGTVSGIDLVPKNLESTVARLVGR